MKAGTMNTIVGRVIKKPSIQTAANRRPSDAVIETAAGQETS